MSKGFVRCAMVAALFTGLLAASPGFSEVGEKPNTPVTAAYVSEINNDWVIVSVNAGTLAANKLPMFEDRLHDSTEIWDMAEFACRLYNRTSVLLSNSYQGNQHFVTRIDYLFACALE